MRRILIVLLMLTGMARAANVNPTMSAATIASTIASTGAGTVNWAAGNYNIGTTNFTIPCGQTDLGPTNALSFNTFSTSTDLSPNPTAHLISTSTNTAIFYINPSCASTVTIEGLDFQGVGIIGNTPTTNLVVKFNTFTHIPAHIPAASGTSNGIYIGGGNSAGQISNVDIEWNVFGDATSCLSPNDVMNSGTDQGGICDGILISGGTNGIINANNVFYHLENGGIKMVCTGTGAGGKFPCETGSLGTQVNVSGIVQHNNDCIQIHRICSEIQPQPMTPVGLQTTNNTMEHMYSPTAFSMGDSFPCCNNGATVPGETTNNDVWVMDVVPGGRMAYDIEWWGNGAQTNNNLHQGYMFFGVAYGHGNSAWTASNNIFQNIAGATFKCYICDEGYGNPIVPTQTGNVTSTTIAAITSVAPSISPSSGAQSFPLTVTMTDAGNTSSAGPLGNTSIFYTTDGTNPVPGCNFGVSGCTTKLYSGPFTLTSSSTVKAVGMYGTGANTMTYPSGYGYVPSASQSATYTGGGLPGAGTPVFAPTSTTFTGLLSVSIADSTAGSSIYYTTDGATPVAGPGGAIIGTQYYISPTGSDSNNGTSVSTPWLSPNHAVNCGDVLNAAAGTYSTINFTSGKWGTVTCTSGNNVAWLKCTTFDTCKISSTTADAMWVDKSFWGVQGWEASTNGSSNNEAACFRMTPSGAYILHHVVFANDIANGCQGGGYGAYNTSTTAGEDYLNVIGSIAYNAAQGAGQCFSGISIYQPINSDTVAGTHIFIGGNFSYGNVDPAVCAGGPPTDGEAVIIDTPDGSQGHLPNPYTGQIVVENNSGFFNGGRGFEIYNNNSGSSHAAVYFEHNTSYGNSTDLNQTGGCFDRGELYQDAAQSVTWSGNLAQTRNGTSCSGEPLYGFIALGTATGSIINNSWWSGVGGHNTDPNTPSAVLGTGNTIGTNPALTNPVNPGAPSCSAFSNVPACMATVIANYTPTASGSTTLGYQTPSPDAVNDPLFPQWLCNVNLPAGLISSACSPIYTGPLTLSTTTTVQAIAAAPSFVNSSVASGTYTVSTPILTGGIQGNTPNVNSLTVGAPAVQQLAIGTYSDGVTRNLPDSFGNTPVWTSSAPTILQVTGTGLVSCLAPGSANSQVKSAPGGIVFNVWGWTCSAAASTVATPVFTPATENFSGTLSVSISTTTAGATIHYTTDGSTPTATSPTYTGPLSIVATTVVKALGVLSGDNPSAIATATYTQVAATISQITLSIVGSTFVNYVLVGGTAHFQANIQYSDGVILPSTTVGVNNARGDSISSWTTSSSMVGTISTGGVFTGASLGSATIQAVINGTLNSSNWVEYVSKSITTNVAGATMRGVTIQ